MAKIVIIHEQLITENELRRIQTSFEQWCFGFTGQIEQYYGEISQVGNNGSLLSLIMITWLFNLISEIESFVCFHILSYKRCMSSWRLRDSMVEQR